MLFFGFEKKKKIKASIVHKTLTRLFFLSVLVVLNDNRERERWKRRKKEKKNCCMHMVIQCAVYIDCACLFFNTFSLIEIQYALKNAAGFLMWIHTPPPPPLPSTTTIIDKDKQLNPNTSKIDCILTFMAHCNNTRNKFFFFAFFSSINFRQIFLFSCPSHTLWRLTNLARSIALSLSLYCGTFPF